MSRTQRPAASKRAVPKARTAIAAVPEPDPAKVVKSEPVALLDTDPETSLGTSLRLHLMSEHQVVGALHLDDEAAAARHAELHAAGHHDHDVQDHRFRPGAALSLLYSAIHENETVVRFLTQAP